ncbi:hypothetical protein RGQ29_022300 [Quercus rubra]|uniref:Large ribosomal subunit protein bL25 beta domain-containing protein n=1 Tax=Quercus rubra TaxID=3512 RepID=A0AAN7F491_QUERU|nr:hypothetical protein RGQ29_022300 [Quercus rubra]
MARWWRSASNILRTAVLSHSSSQPSSAGYHTIQAIPRECVGNRVWSMDRAQGRIPAVVISQHLLQKDSTAPRSISRKSVLNLVFVWADDGSELKVDVPVVFKGEDVCPGLQKGGHLNRVRTSLKYLCPAELIPPKIEVDVSNLDIRDRIFMHDVEVHPSLKLLSKNENMPICKIVATKWENPEPASL